MTNSTDRPPAETPPAQFGLRTLFWLLAALSVWFAAGVWFGPTAMLVLAVMAAAVVYLVCLSPETQEKSCLGVILLSVVIMVAVAVLPALQTAGKGRPSACRNNLYNLGRALEMYHARYGSFPPAFIADAGGKPMHSWRVLLLPYLERNELYRRYRFDEPWDGPNNRLLAKEVLDIFSCPTDDRARPGDTNYVAVVGPRTMWPAPASAGKDDAADGSHNTLLLVEVASSGIHWMEPRDLDVSALKHGINPAKGKGISSGHEGGIMVVFADWHVRFLSDSLDQDVLEALLTRDGNEPIDEQMLQ
ncbi:MAG: DUF1559 domain-containing protein [Pirellulales bacterium]